MTENVKPRRVYRSTKRAEQVAQTRRDILATAGALIREQGYANVSMPVIARESGVAVETIYRAFGSKAGLFTAVIEAAIAGGAARAEVPVRERPAIRAIAEEPDPRRQIELYAATQPGIHRRAGPLSRELAVAGATDPELRALWEQLETARLHGQAGFVAMLAGRGVLRRGLSVEEGRDGLWTLTSMEVWDLLVTRLGWSAERYERWLADRLIDLLLPD
jgi:AcrR family transcriptional regulator